MEDHLQLGAGRLLARIAQARRPGLDAVANLSITTWTELGLLAMFVFSWWLIFHRRPRRAQRPWWAWIGWFLVMLASVLAALWCVHFMGSGALGWVVPTLAAIVVPLYIL